MKFTELKLNEQLIKNVQEIGYEDLTEIQEAAIPSILEGKNVLGLAQTGTGKTATFLLPIINNLMNNPKTTNNPRVLVLAPTRDLVYQIEANFIKYAKNTGIKSVSICGGVGYDKQLRSIKRGVDIVFANTGRLMDLVFKRHDLDLSDVTMLVLDEADLMLDMGFSQDVYKILKKLEQRQQVLLFSATMVSSVKRLIASVYNGPYETIQVKSKNDINDMVKQVAYLVNEKNKIKVLLEILANHKGEQSIIFTRTRVETKAIHGILKCSNLSADSLHSDKTQNARMRTLENFRNNKIQILVATNVAARGIDIDNLGLIINYNLPEQKETYIHRIGRTGRINNKGQAISLVSSGQLRQLKDIERLMKSEIELIKNPEWMEYKGDESLRDFINKNRSSGGERHSRGGRGGYGGERRSYGDRDRSRSNYRGDRSSSYGDRREKSFSDRPRNNYGERKSWNSNSDEKRELKGNSERNREGGYSERRSFNDKDRRPFDRDRKSYNSENRRSYDSNRKSNWSDSKPSYNSDRRNSYSNDRHDNNSYDNKKSSYGNDRRNFNKGSKKSYSSSNNRYSERKSYNKFDK